MENVNKFKVLTLLCFLLIVFPGDKISIVNFFGILALLLDGLGSLQSFNDDYPITIEIFLAISICFSLILIFKKNKFITLLCFITQYSFLLHSFKMDYLRYWYFSVPFFLYFLLSLTVIFLVFKNVMKCINIFFKRL